jgi:RNA polymerase sigma-70 factor (ECF subfamily)
MNEIDRLANLVVERAPTLTLYARQWLDRESAQDVVQEALASLLMQRSAPAEPVAWMFRAVRNAAIDQARATSRRRKREREVATIRREWFESSPDSHLDARTAEQTLAKLSAESREIVVLRIWGELGLAQIGRIMGLSTTTVHERYVEALDRMRLVLEKPCRNAMD